jgi:group I intron endonuclease
MMRRAKIFTHLPESSGVYRLVNVVTLDCYIGGTKNIRQRVILHMQSLRQGKGSCRGLRNSYNEFGADSFKADVIELCDPAFVRERETFWLRRHPRASLNTSRTSCFAANRKAREPITA